MTRCRCRVVCGAAQNSFAAATTWLMVTKAPCTFLSFIYHPIEEAEHEPRARSRFITRLEFTCDVAPVFGPSSSLRSIGPSFPLPGIHARVAAGQPQLLPCSD